MRLNELEVKIQLDSPEHFNQVFEACQKLYGPPSSHVIQLNEYFDTADGQLNDQGLVVRIRQDGDQCLIALKSPRIMLPNGLSNRIELEFAAAEGNQVRQQLSQQGLLVQESSEKERWTFAHDDIEVVLDRLPFLGLFVEVEGPNEAAIAKVLEALNLSLSQAVNENYSELMQIKFRQLNLPDTNIHATFAAEGQQRI